MQLDGCFVGMERAGRDDQVTKAGLNQSTGCVAVGCGRLLNEYRVLRHRCNVYGGVIAATLGTRSRVNWPDVGGYVDGGLEWMCYSGPYAQIKRDVA